MRVRGVWQRLFDKDAGQTASVEEGPPVERGHLARIAVYDSLASYPRVIDLSAPNAKSFLDLLSTKTYQLARERGGEVPFVAIKEAVENLIHAFFRGAVISILDDGNTIRITDRGPGIGDKERAFEPGFSTATDAMKKIIRGVGSGLPIAREVLAFAGGTVSIEDNLDKGTVITLRLRSKARPVVGQVEKSSEQAIAGRLTARQKKVLLLVTELGSAGPSQVSGELMIGLSTAHRDLLALEKEGLIRPDEQGKRSLTEAGMNKLKSILTS